MLRWRPTRHITLLVLWGLLLALCQVHVQASLTPLTNAEDSQNVVDSATDMFENLDTDADGVIERAEIAHFLELNVGGSLLDSSQEISDGMLNVFENIGEDQYKHPLAGQVLTTGQALTQNTDELKLGDLMNYWNRIGSLMTVAEVADWIEHSVQLPMYRDVFQSNAVTGFDFPSLLERPGNDEESLLSSELNITSKLHVKQIERAIKMKLFGIGDEPRSIQNPLCRPGPGHIALAWTGVTDRGSIPIHKYRVRTRAFRVAGSSGSSGSSVSGDSNSSSNELSDDPDWSDWSYVYEHSSKQSFVHEGLSVGATFQYQVQSWNLLGHSEWTETVQCTVIQPKVEIPIVDVNTLAAATTTASATDSLGVGESAGWTILSVFYLIIDSYHALTAFVQVCVALSATGSLAYYCYYIYYLKMTPPHLRNMMDSRDIPIPVPARSNASKIAGSRLTPRSEKASREKNHNHRRSTSSRDLTGKGKNRDRVIRRQKSFSSGIRNNSDLFDLSSCNVCAKKLGWKDDKLGWRYKHICHLCHRAFCQKHGISPHVRGMPCGVPSKCTCNHCLTKKTRAFQKKRVQATLG